MIETAFVNFFIFIFSGLVGLTIGWVARAFYEQVRK